MPQFDYANHVLTILEQRPSCTDEDKGLDEEFAAQCDQRAEVRSHVLRAERLGDCKIERLTASMFSGVRVVRGRPPPFLTTDPVSLKFFTHNVIDFRSGTAWRGGMWNRVRNARWTTARPVLADVGFHGKSALLVRPHYVYD